MEHLSAEEREKLLAKCDDAGHSNVQVGVLAGTLRSLLAQVRSLEQERAELRDRLTCMCGGDVDRHTTGDGHSPVSMHDYYAVSVQQVLDILGAESLYEVHNHHNFGWLERRGGEDLVVIRKGATPNHPRMESFIGGSMGDISVIAQGKDTDENRLAFYSTVHGAGRVMSRTKAAGKWKKVVAEDGRKRRQRVGGTVDWDAVRADLATRNIELRGAGPDEAPEVYSRSR